MLSRPLTILLAWALIAVPALAVAPRRPNVVLILADDLGYGDVGCYNPQRGRISTPHLDRLAGEGMRFTDAHSSSAVCSPTRYSLLTGRYHWRTWLQSGIVQEFGPPLIAADRLTMADLLRQRGYRTACIGKWHLGWNWPLPAQRRPLLFPPNRNESAIPTAEQLALWQETFGQPMTGGPLDCGFDSFFGVDLPNYPPFCFIENDRTVGIPSDFLPKELLRHNQADFNGPALAAWQLEPVLPTIVDRACEYIRKAAERSEPFFLYLPLTSPHTPLAVNQTWQGKSGLNDYADLVMETDAMVGQTLAALEQSGRREQTLVIFTSDNGCAPYVGIDELKRAGHFSSGPWRGYKSDVWEGGHRVPFIIRWPGVVAPGAVCDRLVEQVDLMATVADVLATVMPANAGEDSGSLLPLLTGEADAAAGVATAVHQSLRGLLAIRRGPWKLIFGPGSGGWTKGGDAQPQQLYHLADDPDESTNVFAEQPQIAAELKQLMADYVTNGRSTPGATQANDVPVEWRRFISKVAKP